MRDPASRNEPGGWAAWAGDLWQPRDPAFHDLGPGGELLASRLRLALAWAGLFAANAALLVPSHRPRPLALAALALGLALAAHAAVAWTYRPALSGATVVLDVGLATIAAEIARATGADQGAALLIALLMALLLAGLRHDPALMGVAALAGGAALISCGAANAARLGVLALAATLLALLLARARRFHALADTDPLAGLRRRDTFEEWLRAELQRSRRHSHRLTLAFVEIDRYRELVERHGGARGTAIQRSAAGVLKRSLRSTDAVACWANGLFALALPETAAADVHERLAVLREAIAQASRGGAAAPVGVSVGVAAWPDDGPESAGLIAAAEERLRAAREAGGDRLIGPPPAPGAPGKDTTA